jgi:hypothetical protein
MWHSIYRKIFKIWRVKRLKLFAALLTPTHSDRMIDIGGYPGNWIIHPPLVGSLDTLNLDDVRFEPASSPYHNIKVLVGDGCKLPFADGSYDIAFSNSVIEHVGEWENQTRFAAEIRRVGMRLWCQTPARECPIEPHYFAPFVHWFPKNIQMRIIRYLTPWGLINRPNRKVIQNMVDTTRLISRKEMHELFPDCRILIEYLLPGIPKSYIAMRLANQVMEPTIEKPK